MNKWYWFGIAVVILLVTVFTLPPSTPTVSAEACLSPQIVEMQGGPDEDDEDVIDPFTQDDLRLLSGNVLRPNGMFWHDGYLYIGCNGDFTIYRVDADTGATITYVSGVENVNEFYVEDGPSLWIPDFSRNTFTLVDRENVNQPRTDLADDLAAPWGIAPLEDNFLLTMFRSGDLVQATREGEVEVVATGFRSPTGIVVHDDIVFVANHDSARRSIEWFELAATADGPLADTDMQQLVKGLQFTTNLVMGPDGMLYFAYALGQRGVVGRVDPAVCIEAGGCSNIDVEPVVWTELQAPLVGLNITPNMRLFIHSQYGAEIYWIQLPDAPLSPTPGG